MNARSFVLKSGTEVYDMSMNSDTNTFLHEPTGLGFSMDADFVENADSFYYSSVFKGEQSSVSGELMFLPAQGKSPYEFYKKFMSFVHSATANTEGLKLGYCTPNGKYEAMTQYFAAVKLKSIDKGELDEYGVLRCDVEFSLLTPWAEETTRTYSMDDIPNTELKYGGTKKYGNAFDTDQDGTVEQYPDAYIYGQDKGIQQFVIGGHMPGAYVFKVWGPFEHPSIFIHHQEDGEWKEVGGVMFTDDSCSLEEGDMLEISTRPDNTYIIKRTLAGVVSDLTRYVSFDHDPFGRPPVGSCRLVIGAGFKSTSTLSIYDYYRSV